MHVITAEEAIREIAATQQLAPVLGLYAPGRESNSGSRNSRRIGGSSIRLQVHYSKVDGSEEKSRSSVGMIFAEITIRVLNTPDQQRLLSIRRRSAHHRRLLDAATPSPDSDHATHALARAAMEVMPSTRRPQDGDANVRSIILVATNFH